MLHVAAWPTGVQAWTRILSLMNLPEMSEAHTDKLLTQASVLAATGKRLPAHLRDAHPGFELGLRLILDCFLPVPLRTYLTEVLSPTVAEESGWLMASADPSIRFFFSCGCLLASMARSVNCLGRKNAVQVHLIGAKPIVQVKR